VSHQQILQVNPSDVHQSKNLIIGTKSTFAAEAIYETPLREVVSGA
jgi:fructose-1,6-bisphosphatase